MRLETYIGTNCHPRLCPTIYRSDRGTFVVQGNLIDSSELESLTIPSHEGVVEVPESLIRALADKMAGE